MTDEIRPSGYDPTVIDAETGDPLWMSTIPAVQRTIASGGEQPEESNVIPFPRKPAVRRAYVDPRREGWVEALADALYGPEDETG